jgi:hypothetical protein
MSRIARITLIFEVLLAVALAMSIADMVIYWIATAIFSMLLMTVPMILSVKNIIQLPWPMVVSIGLAFLLHNMGLVTHMYDNTFWWDKLTHLVSGVVIASLVGLVDE